MRLQVAAVRMDCRAVEAVGSSMARVCTPHTLSRFTDPKERQEQEHEQEARRTWKHTASQRGLMRRALG